MYVFICHRDNYKDNSKVKNVIINKNVKKRNKNIYVKNISN